MRNFTDKDAIAKIDPRDTLGSTEQLVAQCAEAWKEVHALTLPETIGDVNKIVACGMGASIYGALVLRSLLGRDLPCPVEIVSDYHIPLYTDAKTLVILTSYSGTTEEVLSCAHEAKAAGAKIVVITRGGPLADFAKTNNYPSYIFDPKLNPAGVPRLGNGYTILGLFGLLSRLRVIDIEEREITDVITRMREKEQELRKKAQVDYAKFTNKIPVILTAEHLFGNAHILRNQFNETSKAFSCFFMAPDLNHHLMEGLQFPKDAPLQFLSLESGNYAPKIQTRMELTKDVIKQNKHEIFSFTASGATVYDDFLETLLYGSFVTLYLALYYDQNPAINPWVDYFKEKLR